MQLVSGKFGTLAPCEDSEAENLQAQLQMAGGRSLGRQQKAFLGAVLISESKPPRYGLFQGSEGLGWAVDPSHQQSPWVPERNLNFGKQN